MYTEKALDLINSFINSELKGNIVMPNRNLD